MPSKKKKYNARFPAGRIKKIMQTDEEVGKVAQAVPVIISRTLELFVGSLLTKAMQITSARNAKTLSPLHMKQCILSEQRFDFLKDLVKSVQDTSNGDEEMATAAPSLLTSRTNKYVHERRKSNTVLMKEESIVKQETVIKNLGKEEPVPEPSKVEANCSNRHMNPGFYSEINPEDRIIKQETIVKNLVKEGPVPESSKVEANCSNRLLNPGFYSEINPEDRIIKHETIVKNDDKEDDLADSSKVVANCSTRLNPGFYSEINHEQRISKQETVTKNVDKEEQQTDSSKMLANCSKRPLNPGFYSEINPEEQRVHQTPGAPWYPPQPPYIDRASPVLVMDEDYDT